MASRKFIKCSEKIFVSLEYILWKDLLKLIIYIPCNFYRHFIRIILIWNGHVHIFTYSNKKDFCPQPIWYFNSLIPLHTTNNFTEIQFSYENLTGIIIKKDWDGKKRIPIKIKKEFVLTDIFEDFLKTYWISIVEY